MKTLLLISVVLLILAGCAGSSKINLIPMYGHAPKPLYLLNADKKFIDLAVEKHGTLDSASRHYVNVAWSYFYAKDYGVAMKRFNQAWLLDSANSDVYWGFGSIYGNWGYPADSVLKYYDLSRKYGNTNKRLKANIAYTLGKKALALMNSGDSSWVTFHDSSMNLYTEITPSTKEDCDLTMQYWETALLLDDKINIVRAKNTVDSTGYMPWNKAYYDALQAETVKRQKKWDGK